MRIILKIVILLLLVLAAFMPAQLQANANYQITATINGNPSQLNVGTNYTVFMDVNNSTGSTVTLKVHMLQPQAWFLNGSTTAIGGGGTLTSCTDVDGVIVRDCTVSVPPFDYIELSTPMIARMCLEASVVPHWQLFQGSTKVDEAAGPYTGGTGRITCTVDTTQWPATIAHNTSIADEQTFVTLGFSSATSARLRLGIDTYDKADYDVSGVNDLMEASASNPFFFIGYGTPCVDHAYCDRSWTGFVSTRVVTIDYWYHTKATLGDNKKYLRIYDAASTLIFERIVHYTIT